MMISSMWMSQSILFSIIPESWEGFIILTFPFVNTPRTWQDTTVIVHGKQTKNESNGSVP